MVSMKPTPQLKNPYLVAQVYDDGTISMMNTVATIDDAIYLADEYRVSLKPEYQHQIGIFHLVETA